MNNLTLGASALLAGSAWMASSAQAQTQFPQYAYNGCPVTATEFKSDWLKIGAEINLPTDLGPFYGVESGTPYVFPNDGAGFPSDNTFCDFYKWGAQMFLWLSSSVNSIPTQTTSGASDAETPYVLSSEFIYTAQPVTSGGSASATNPSFLFKAQSDSVSQNGGITIRTPKPIDADGNAEAGSNAVLITQPANNVSKESTLVYYGVQTNRPFGYLLQQQTPEANVDFLTSGEEICTLIEYASDSGFASITGNAQEIAHLVCPDQFSAGSLTPPVSIPELEPAIDVLSLTMELKTAWVKADSLQTPEKYIRQMGTVLEYDTSGATKWTNPTPSSAPVELALIGMHVVGSVAGHPEMIWATIEHVDNAPNTTYDYNICSTIYDCPVDQLTEISATATGDWLLSDGTATNANQKTATVQSDGSIQAATAGGTIAPTNVNRSVPWGNPNDNPSTSNKAEIASLKNALLVSMNRDVQDHVRAAQENDPRQYYFLSGAVWSDGGAIPVQGSAAQTLGSTQLANSALETFTQGGGCFSCHSNWTGNADEGSVTLSHIFGSFIKSGEDYLPKAGN